MLKENFQVILVLLLLFSNLLCLQHSCFSCLSLLNPITHNIQIFIIIHLLIIIIGREKHVRDSELQMPCWKLEEETLSMVLISRFLSELHRIQLTWTDADLLNSATRMVIFLIKHFKMTHNCGTPVQTLNYRLGHDSRSVAINLDLMLQL